MSCDTISVGAVGFAYGFTLSAILFGVLSRNRNRNHAESIISTMTSINKTLNKKLEDNKIVIDDLSSRIRKAIQTAETLQMDLDEDIYEDMPPLIPFKDLDDSDTINLPPIPPPAQRTETYADMLEHTCSVTFTVPTYSHADKTD